MSFDLKYVTLCGTESYTRYGTIGVRIEVAGAKLPDPATEAIRYAAYDAERAIQNAIMTALVATDPDAQKRRTAERAQIVGLFPAPIYVEEIPNGYCADWCCKHLPWFIVTTTVGRIKIGWRKRVIEIDWSQTTGTKTAAELFADEDVTKDERMIHAWGEDKARAYVAAIVASTA